jgi:hypothetical protein
VTATISEIFGAFSQLMGICPCCGDFFYLAEAHPYYEGHKPRSPLNKLRAEEYRLAEAEQRLDDLEWKLRERPRRPGSKRRSACCGKSTRSSAGRGMTRRTSKSCLIP